MLKTPRLLVCVSLAAVVCLASTMASGAIATWTNAGGGDWWDPANW